jgi:hypothetical protein
MLRTVLELCADQSVFISVHSDFQSKPMRVLRLSGFTGGAGQI